MAYSFAQMATRLIFIRKINEVLYMNNSTYSTNRSVNYTPSVLKAIPT